MWGAGTYQASAFYQSVGGVAEVEGTHAAGGLSIGASLLEGNWSAL